MRQGRHDPEVLILLKDLETRLAATLPRDVLMEAFYSIGEAEPGVVARAPQQSRWRIVADRENCSCLSDSDYTCGSGSPTVPTNTCVAGGCQDTNCCCGFLWLFGCDGLCK